MPAPQETKTSNPEPVPEQPTRELSQTDCLNKKLLTSLFKRMDEGGDSKLAKMLEPEEERDEVDEWKD